MRDLLPFFCSGQAQRADGSSSSAALNQGAYDPARPAFGGWPPPERRRESSQIRTIGNMQGGIFFASLYRIAPRVGNALVFVKPETVIRWHRAGFRSFWRWKSRCRGGIPKVPLEIRQLIHAMSLANPPWG